MVYILYWDTNIIGYFSTAEKAEEKKQKLIQEAKDKNWDKDFTAESSYFITSEKLDR